MLGLGMEFKRRILWGLNLKKKNSTNNVMLGLGLEFKRRILQI
jgi:hypothetical protein